MEQYNIIGAPDSIKVEWEFTFPDEKRHNTYLGSVYGCYDGCLEGSPEDVYSEYYVDAAASFVMSLYCPSDGCLYARNHSLWHDL